MKKNIILIEDDEALCKELSPILRDRGYKLSVFTDPELGLKELSLNTYDLLLLDLKMPKLSGLDILKIARRKTLPVKIIIITGNPIIKKDGHTGIPGTTDETKLSSADFVINKPFDPEVLLSTIDTLLR